MILEGIILKMCFLECFIIIIIFIEMKDACSGTDSSIQLRIYSGLETCFFEQGKFLKTETKILYCLVFTLLYAFS